MIQQLFLCIILFSAVSSCQKDKLPGTEPIDIYLEDEPYENWAIIIKSKEYKASRLEILGPNNFYREYDYNQLVHGITIADSAKPENSGKYIAYLYDGTGIIKATGSIDIIVKPIPSPPCIVEDNSSLTTLSGIGPTNYTNISTENDGWFLDVKGVLGSNTFLMFTFKNVFENFVLPGIYPTDAESNINFQKKKCAVVLKNNGTIFFVKRDESVYVTIENGKLVYTLCDVEFINNTTSETFLVSARLVTP